MNTLKNYHRSYKDLIWVLATIILTLFCLQLAATNLANMHPVSGDDGWIMSASYKLASEGIFGSDMYAGFFNADHHYFIALPLYHFLQATSFKLFGFGVFQARLPNLFSAILLVWIVSSLARRYHGRKTALLAALLLVFLCPNPFSPKPCSMLLLYAHNGRYDLTATTLAWLGVWQLDNFWRRPRPINAIGLGIISGLATLTQFFGAFILIPTAVLFFLRWGKGLWKQRTLYLTVTGFLAVVSPYIVYILINLEDFSGQSILKSGRVDLWRASFYLDNFRREPQRFSAMFQRLESLLNGHNLFQTIGLLLLAFGLAAGLILIVKQSGQGGNKRWPVHWLSSLAFIYGLAFFEQTKAPVYFILLLPGICLALAAWSMAVLRWAKLSEGPVVFRAVMAVPAVLLIVFLSLNGLLSHRALLTTARNTSPYQSITGRIKTNLLSGSVVLGSERWWPGLVEYEYLALNNLFSQWRVGEANGRSPNFSEQAQAVSADYLIVNANILGDLAYNPERLQNQFQNYLNACGNLLDDWENQSYGRIQIYRLTC